MNKELAKTLTTALVQFIDKNQLKDKMGVSSIEAEALERCITEEKFDRVEDWYANRMKPEPTEFEEKLVSFALQCGGQWDTANEEAEKWSNELLALAKEQLLSYADESNPKIEAMAELERTFKCNPDNLPLWLKNELDRIRLEAETKGYEKGYKKGYEVAEKVHNAPSFIPYQPLPLYQSRPLCWEPGGTCTNPHMDCINCPRNITGGFNTSSGTSTAKTELNKEEKK